MRSRVSASGFVVAASIAVVGMVGGPALAVGVPPADAVTAETDGLTEAHGQDSGEEDAATDTLGQVLDEVDGAVESTADAVREGTNDAPEPVGSTVDGGVDAVADTTSQTTDMVRQTLGDADPPSDPTDGGGGGETPRRGAGDQPSAAPGPSGASSAPPAGSPVAGGGAPAPVPDRIALDGFRRTSDATAAVEVADDSVFEPEPAFAPPTTRQVVEPVASGPALPLRAVAIEILVAAALLVFATGGLLAELGPERA
ncbi:MAG: hypothetical protein KY437_06380 [Actinobacteria bacterium]|nr:hypothetical protein [Actinomycetota bacterium]